MCGRRISRSVTRRGPLSIAHPFRHGAGDACGTGWTRGQGREVAYSPLLQGRGMGDGAITRPACPSPLRLASELTSLRSEEPTTELQSLMRISSAVFCLKKQ